MKLFILISIAAALAAHAQDALLGVTAESVDSETQRHYSRLIPKHVGLAVVQIAPGSPAEKFLLPGDVLLKADGKPLRTPSDLKAAVSEHRPGDSLGLIALRHGELCALNVGLGSRTPQVRLKGKELSEFNRLLLLMLPHDGAPVDVPAVRRQMLKLADMGLAAREEDGTVRIHMAAEGGMICAASCERGLTIEDSCPGSQNCFLEASAYKRDDVCLPKALADRLIRSTYYRP